MADSQKNDSDIDYTSPITTEEDMFNGLGGQQLQPRIRKAPHVLGSTPSPLPPPPPPPPPKKNDSKKKNKKNKKNTSKKTTPLVNSVRTNQSSNNNNNKTKKRTRNKASKSSSTPIDPAPPSVPPSSTLQGNHICCLCISVLCVEHTDHLFYDLSFL